MNRIEEIRSRLEAIPQGEWQDRRFDECQHVFFADDYGLLMIVSTYREQDGRDEKERAEYAEKEKLGQAFIEFMRHVRGDMNLLLGVLDTIKKAGETYDAKRKMTP